MRRKDREITDINDILSIVEKCDTCRIALFDKEYPYIVPMNFGCNYNSTNLELYFHCANEGLKLDLIKDNNHAAFEMDCSHKLIAGESACEYSMEFESVCGQGLMEILKPDEKRDALTILMRQYSNAEAFQFQDRILEKVTVLKLKVESITGKRLLKN
ncbi:pyridoxamine 5'-phosphate oxidase family protein [Anaerocolumna xylanovorans]|uniref:Pyridoxamine 5'-phosphate oxidase n=1 Tax=Anaerocolumna xylanovorans DSM 12503 TaxID=1121345 RepID=A0A1M7YGL3_9FIRM|nr:pyridoxamine 5'-phosphate oxidase family protein [Anaerocolumna xylanovorans]SHO51731.1 hypothetical protein SAMN02745217_03299 [Anaerocolumna xylanovorans DSM 12503]